MVLFFGIIFLFSILFILVFIILLVILSVVCRVCTINFIFRRGSEDEKGVMLGIGNLLLLFV